MTFFCGIYIYVITWILLGQEKEKTISPKLKTDFTVRHDSTGQWIRIAQHKLTVELAQLSRQFKVVLD